MNRILLALVLWSLGGAAFLGARQSTTRLQHEANTTHDTWVLQTQTTAAAGSKQAVLAERVRQLQEASTQVPTPTENPVWLALQTNHVSHLSPELRERLFEELGLNWKSSEEFIVVSKDTIHEIQMRTIQNARLTESASSVLALTPDERDQVEAVFQRVHTDFNEWAQSHTERTDPKTVSNRCAAGLFVAVGKERMELILPDLPGFLLDVGFAPAFRPVFPNGWADVAQQEGFELPPDKPQEK